MKCAKGAFRVGRVRADLRGKVWYLACHENGVRHRPRVGPIGARRARCVAEHSLKIAEARLSGLTHEELSEQFGKSTPTIRAALHYAEETPARQTAPAACRT